ncbi:hypothetical protein K3495_g419 [Podosphaera aphanis]|nr:hypothetical protein K3495_g419 [Podosphaera aphanis]
MCDLWEIVIGKEKPIHQNSVQYKNWKYRERIARVMIKNTLGPVDYHQATGAQGKVDLVWKFWSMRCGKNDSVRQFIGNIRATQLELVEMGVIIDDNMVAILMSKSLPPSYDNYVSSIFARISDLEHVKSTYIANKIFEEEIRRSSTFEDANVVTTPKFCSNCNKPGHLKADCFAKGGVKAGQGLRQIARRKVLVAERKKQAGHV